MSLVLAIVCALAGIAAAIAIYVRKVARPVEPQILAEGWKYDQAVSAFMGGPGRKAFDAIAWFDKNVVDGAVEGSGKVIYGSDAHALKPERIAYNLDPVRALAIAPEAKARILGGNALRVYSTILPDTHEPS